MRPSKKIIVLLFLISPFFLFSFTDNLPVSKSKQIYFRLQEGVTAKDYLPNTIILKLKEKNRSGSENNSINSSVLNYALNSIGATSTKKMFSDAVKPASEFSHDGEKMADLSLIYIIKYSSGANIEDAINVIYNTNEVEYAQPKYIQQVEFTPNDPSYTSASGQYFINKIQCPAGWDIQKGDTNVVIGIVDSGTDWDHPDLAANLKLNYADPIDGIDNDGDGYTDNYRGWDLGGADYNNVVADNNPMIMGANNNHGSHTSGDACAVTNNGVGVASPGFNCKFLPVKCSADNDTRGPGGVGYIITGYEGIKYAADHGCAVINCSWGGTGGGQFEQDVINYATINKNSLVMCSAGNDNNAVPHFPSSYKYAMSVASTTSNDIKSSFSCFGTDIDVCAPGSGIYSTLYNNSYANLDGTSMASPIAAGVAAIIKAQFPSYTSLQVGEKLRVTCDNIDAGNPSYAGQLGKGRVNMLRALTVSSPAVRLNSYTVVDNNNNIPQVNDTLTITGTFKNYLEATTGLSVSITTTSTAVTLMNATSTMGVINTLASASNTSAPFKVKVNSNAPLNSIVTFKINYTDGTYSDFEYFQVVVNPNYFDMNINKIKTTINSKGNFGYNNYSTNTQGVGFIYNNTGSTLLFEGGLICATSNTKIANVVRGATPSTQDNDFTNIIPFQITQPGVISNQDGYTQFNDNGAGASKIGITVSKNTYAFTDEANDDYIIMKYRIKNTSGAALSNFYIGLFADWDIGADGALNKADYDAVNKLGYIWRADNNPTNYVGISLLEGNNTNYWAIDNDNAVTGNPWGIYDSFTDAEKFQSISTPNGRLQAGGTTGRDVAMSFGTGSYNIPIDGEIVVAFALVGANNLADLKTNAANAKIKYSQVVGVGNQSSTLPDRFSLSQNYPNPFNPATTISYSLPKASDVTVKIYNILGNEIMTLESGFKNAGNYNINFNASALASGVYYYKIQAGDFSDVKKLTLLK
jgi:subtilisin family serine protease